ncbi:MAG: response regulator transcription factor [Acidimicrobiia bacterium]
MSDSPDASHRRTPGSSRADGCTELTPREFTVLERLALGYTNAEISAELHISPRTTATHVSVILRKLGCRNRTHAAATYFRELVLS